MAAGRFRLGSPEADFGAYAEWGQKHDVRSRELAAEAAVLCLWGSVWDTANCTSDFYLGTERLMAFASDAEAATVFRRWRVHEWHDRDYGSVPLLMIARARIKAAFRPAQSPTGERFWSSFISKAKGVLVHSNLNAEPSLIIPTRILDSIMTLDIGGGSMLMSSHAGSSRVETGEQS